MYNDCLTDELVSYVNMDKWRDTRPLEEIRAYMKKMYKRVYRHYHLPLPSSSQYSNASGILLVCKNKILCVCEQTSNMWGIPKGKREVRAFENERQAWQRELYEETGIILPKSSKLLQTHYVERYFCDVVEVEEEIACTIHEEITHIKWIDALSLSEYMFNSITKDLIAKIAQTGIIKLSTNVYNFVTYNDTMKGRFFALEKRNLRIIKDIVIRKLESHDVLHDIYLCYLKLKDTYSKGIHTLSPLEQYHHQKLLSYVQTTYRPLKPYENHHTMLAVLYSHIIQHVEEPDKHMLFNTLTNINSNSINFRHRYLDELALERHKDYMHLGKHITLKMFVKNKKVFNFIKIVDKCVTKMYIDCEYHRMQKINANGLKICNRLTKFEGTPLPYSWKRIGPLILLISLIRSTSPIFRDVITRLRQQMLRYVRQAIKLLPSLPKRGRSST